MIAPPFDENDPDARRVDPNDPPPPPAVPGGTTPPAAGPPAAATTPVSPYNREQFRDQWMRTGTNTTQQNALLGQYGLTADAAGRVALPTDVNGHAGETLDLRIGARAGQNLAGWTDIGQNGSSNGNGGYGGAMGSGGALGDSGAGGGGFQGQMRAMLMQMLNGANTPVDENSAGVAQPYQAAKLAADRGVADEQKALAERLYAEGGGGSNELTQGIQQSRERNATGLAGIKSQLMQRAMDQKQSQLQQALSLAVQSGDNESARAIQLQIAQMSNALGQAQLSQSGRQFDANLGQRQNEWNDQFGLEGARFRYDQDRDVVNAGLNNGGN